MLSTVRAVEMWIRAARKPFAGGIVVAKDLQEL